MSTRSCIGIIHANGSIEGVYCHYDGRPEGVGATLTNHYNSSKLARELVELGNLSSLGDTLAETVAYARDRGEDKEFVFYDNLDEMLREAWPDFGTEHAYIWDGTAWSGHTTRPGHY
jgi:hypothetical protein